MKIRLSELKKIIQEEMSSVKEVHHDEFPDRDAGAHHDADWVVDYPDDPGPDADEVTLTPDELAGLAYEVGIPDTEVSGRFEFRLEVEPWLDDDGYEIRGQSTERIRAIDSVTGEHYLSDAFGDGDWERLRE
jgi:hypothetical protein